MPEVFKAAYFEIANYILNSFEKLDLNTIEKFIQLLVTAYKEERGVLVVGMGRSGLVARGFAMRLRHLGLHSYVLGETITPPVKKTTSW
jgi:6-phospho-3-hexuloisomerase